MKAQYKVSSEDISFFQDLTTREPDSELRFCKRMTISGVRGWFCVYVEGGWVGTHFGPWRWVTEARAKAARARWKAATELEEASNP